MFVYALYCEVLSLVCLFLCSEIRAKYTETSAKTGYNIGELSKNPFPLALTELQIQRSRLTCSLLSSLICIQLEVALPCWCDTFTVAAVSTGSQGQCLPPSLKQLLFVWLSCCLLNCHTAVFSVGVPIPAFTSTSPLLRSFVFDDSRGFCLCRSREDLL